MSLYNFKYICLLLIFVYQSYGNLNKKSSSCNMDCSLCAMKRVICSQHENMNDAMCQCCRHCPRIMGQYCDSRNPCDFSQHLTCQEISPNNSICKRIREIGRICIFNGIAYKSDTRFSISCRYHCQCYDGFVSCQDICKAVEESPPPPTTICTNGAELLPPSFERCCREWACKADFINIFDQFLFKSIKRRNNVKRICSKDTGIDTPWSQCSKTCGMGTSLRMSTNNVMCLNVTQTRHCFHKQCNPNVSMIRKKKQETCVPTIRSTSIINIKVSFKNEYNGTIIMCQSKRKFRPRYCNNACTGCCRPISSKTKRIEFACSDAKNRIKMYEWIKSCKCIAESCS